MKRIQVVVCVFCIMLISGCISKTIAKRDLTLEKSEIRAACRERFGWGDITEAFGIPTVCLTELDIPFFARIQPSSTAYRVKIANPEFVDGTGPVAKTASCIVQGTSLLFLETDAAVIELISMSETLPNSPTEAIEFVETFLVLRGFELQIGPPSKHNPWVVKIEDGFWDLYPATPEERDPAKWNIVIDRSADGWAIEFTAVSPDSYECFRYRIVIPRRGIATLENVILVYKPVTFI